MLAPMLTLQVGNAIWSCLANWSCFIPCSPSCFICGSSTQHGASFVCSPQETYNYYYLPFCKPNVPGKPKHKWGGLGEVLQGNELIDSQLEVKFRSQCSYFFSACFNCDRLVAAPAWLQALHSADCQHECCTKMQDARTSGTCWAPAAVLHPSQQHCCLPHAQTLAC